MSFLNFVSTVNFPHRDDFYLLRSEDSKATYAFSKERFLKSMFFNALLKRKKITYEHFLPEICFFPSPSNDYWIVDLNYKKETCTFRHIREKICLYPSSPNQRPLEKKISKDDSFAPSIFFKSKRESVWMSSCVKIYFKERRALCYNGSSWYHLNHSNIQDFSHSFGGENFFIETNIFFDFENFLLWDNADAVKRYFKEFHGVSGEDFRSIHYFYVRKCAKNLPIFSKNELKIIRAHQSGTSLILLSFLRKMKISVGDRYDFFEFLFHDFKNSFSSDCDFKWFKNDFFPNFLIQRHRLDPSELKLVRFGINFFNRLNKNRLNKKIQFSDFFDREIVSEFVRDIRQRGLSLYEKDETVDEINDELTTTLSCARFLKKEEFLNISNKKIIDSIICQKVYETLNKAAKKKFFPPFVVLQRCDSNTNRPTHWIAMTSNKNVVKKTKKMILISNNQNF